MKITSDKQSESRDMRWYVAIASIALSGMAINIERLYGYQHDLIIRKRDMLALLNNARFVAGSVALIFAIWAMTFLPRFARYLVLVIGILAFGLCLTIM